MGRLSLSQPTVACINGLLASSRQTTPDTNFNIDEIVEIFESLMPEPAQRIEPVWSIRSGHWQWLPVES